MSLVELTVAVTFLGVVLTTIAGLTVEAAQRAQTLAGQSRRQAAVVEEVNRLTSLPWASLTPGTSCQTLTDVGFPHTRCVTVTSITSFMRQVRLIVTPSQPGVRPDTVLFTRANAPAVNYLKT
jgi:hypothetical protein